MKKIFLYITVCLAVFTLTSCDEHEAYDTSVYAGDILLHDGSVIRLQDLNMSVHSPVAVFYAGANNEHGPLAVLLDETPQLAFADTLGIDMGTSASETACDGETNTVAMQARLSPLADYAFKAHSLQQSDYIPSVREMEMLYHSHDIVNKVITACGGTPVAISGDECWYWTSSECSFNKGNQAWLFSMADGSRHPASKTNIYHARLVMEYRGQHKDK